MNLDAFSFFNRQLAAMLRDGLPLEGALKQLCAQLARGPMRAEFERLEQDLAAGTPLPEALERRKLPALYRQLVQIGVRGQNLPGALTLAADYYEQADSLWTRLKGLMVYPVLLVLASLALSVVLAMVFGAPGGFWDDMMGDVTGGDGTRMPAGVWLALFGPPILLGLLAVAVLAVLLVPRWRHALQWRLPAMREGCLARFAAAVAMLLRQGCPLPESLRLMAGLAESPAARREIKAWEGALAAGERGLPTEAGRWPVFPRLFRWLATSEPENWVTGFERAARVYHNRAVARAEMLLNGALPVSILAVASVTAMQVILTSQFVLRTSLDTLGGLGP